MAERKRYGRLFYVALAFVVVCVAVPTCVSIVVVNYVSEYSAAQLKAIIDSVFSSALDRYSSVDPGGEHDAELIELLNPDGLIDAVAGQESIDEETATALLARLEELSDILYSYMDNPHSVALLFLESGELISVGEDVVGAYTQAELAAFAEIELETGEEVFYLHTDGSLRTTTVHAIAEGVLLLSTRDEEEYLEDALAFLLSLEYVQEIVQYDAFGTIRVIYGDGSLAAAFSYDNFTLLDETTSIEAEIEGSLSLCCYFAYSGTGIVFAIFMDDSYPAFRYATYALVAFVVLAAVVACCLLVVLFNGQIYAPIRHLASSVAPEGDSGRNELADLEHGIARLESENERWGNLVRDAALLHLLHGQGALATESECTGFPFDEGDSCVIVGVQVDPLPDEPAPEPAPAPAQDIAALRDEAAALLADELGAEGFGEIVVTGDGIMGILVIRADGRAREDSARLVLSACERAREAVLGRGAGSVSLLVSEQVGCGRGMKEGYDQVSALAEHCLAMERLGMVLGYRDFKDDLRRVGDFDAEAAQRFFEAVQDLSLERAAACFDDVVAGMGQQQNGFVRKDDATMVTLCSLFRLGLRSCPTARAANFDWEAQLTCELDRATTCAGVREAMLSTMGAVKAAGDRASLDRRRFEQVERYVRDNIADANLSGQMVAVHFGMSQPNVTRLFKKFTGDGFLSYVHALRVDLAKQILEQTDDALDDVARQVGFGNALTMSRAFRKVTGQTPHSYREAHRKQQA